MLVRLPSHGQRVGVVERPARRPSYARVRPKVALVLKHGWGAWVAWPRKASGVQTDLAETGIRRAAIAQGLVDLRVCAIATTWSGLRIARRRQASL